LLLSLAANAPLALFFTARVTPAFPSSPRTRRGNGAPRSAQTMRLAARLLLAIGESLRPAALHRGFSVRGAVLPAAGQRPALSGRDLRQAFARLHRTPVQPLKAEPHSGPGRLPATSRVRACEARPRAPHPAPTEMTPHDSAPGRNRTAMLIVLLGIRIKDYFLRFRPVARVERSATRERSRDWPRISLRSSGLRDGPAAPARQNDGKDGQRPGMTDDASFTRTMHKSPNSEAHSVRPRASGDTDSRQSEKTEWAPAFAGANGDCCVIPDFAALIRANEMGRLRQRARMTEKKASAPE